MRHSPNLKVETYRIVGGPLASSRADGNNGAFMLPHFESRGPTIAAIISDGMGWDHVSVSIPDRRRCPTWEEMVYVKRLFFRDDETVIQYHPRRSDYVDCHQFCLHLWRPQNAELPVPDPEMVGPRSVQPLTPGP